LRSTLNEELHRLSLPAADKQRFASLRRWLRKSDVLSIPPAQQQTLRELLGQSGAMRTLVDMRTELAAVWERGNASREQMLALLQDWIARAEASGIRALQDAALRIRSYAPAPG
jgi:stearoyl-CoA desaturase (delta-9 desaturase)